jgi:hypothetical protein
MIKKIFVFTVIAISFLGCQGMRENLSMKKKQGVDEFLIKKKNPLVLPPDYSELPKPVDETVTQNTIDNNIDISKILDNTKKKNNDTESTNTSKDLEKSISNILNKK